MRDKIELILENDQICYRENPHDQNEYRSKLSLKQAEETQVLFDFLKEKFDIRLKIWHNIPLDTQDSSVQNISPVLANLDVLSLNSIFQIC